MADGLVERLREKALVVAFDDERALMREAADAIEAVLRRHHPVPFQGREYCSTCRVKYWPRENPPEAAWPCGIARTLGVSVPQDVPS